MSDVPSSLDTAKFRHLVLDQLANLQGFQVPEYDDLVVTYYGATNNIATVVYKKSTAVVATLTLLYSVQPPTFDNANLVRVTIS